MRGVGSAIFAAILLTVAGTLNIIYGIGAISNAHFFNTTSYVVSSLHTWGWITLLLGIVQLTAGFSLMGGRPYGRIIGIAAATVGAVESLLNVSGNYPFWSLGVFAICLIVIDGLVVLGEPERPSGV